MPFVNYGDFKEVSYPRHPYSATRNSGKLLAEGLPMSTYRLYFRDGKHWICGRQDFEADTKSAAVSIARELADACSDVCRSFELWNDHKLVYEPPDIGEVCRLNERHQEIVLRTEEMIRWSNWRIAESQVLIERLDAATAKRRHRGLV